MRPREAPKVTCAMCGGQTAMGTVYLAHVRRCERATPEARAVFHDTGRWPSTAPPRIPRGDSQLPLF